MSSHQSTEKLLQEVEKLIKRKGSKSSLSSKASSSSSDPQKKG